MIGLVKLLMLQRRMTRREAKEFKEELHRRVKEGRDPEDVLKEKGLAVDFFFDIA
ncbi:MAG: hypothetical protein IJ741_03505 [Schwartzia sp.]|nr:hypothetical protein [Schwartzia sp. (in: firmicutes)]